MICRDVLHLISIGAAVRGPSHAARTNKTGRNRFAQRGARPERILATWRADHHQQQQRPPSASLSPSGSAAAADVAVGVV